MSYITPYRVKLKKKKIRQRPNGIYEKILKYPIIIVIFETFTKFKILYVLDIIYVFVKSSEVTSDFLIF